MLLTYRAFPFPFDYLPACASTGSFINSVKTRGRLSLGFDVFNALTVTAFNLCYLAEFDAQYLAKAWRASGVFMSHDDHGPVLN